MKRIALFDFDETLIKENSLSHLFKFLLGNKPLALYLFPLLFNRKFYTSAYKKEIKNRLYKKALANKTNKQVYEAGVHSAKQLTQLDSVVEKMKALNNSGVEIWIITASPQIYIEGIIDVFEWPVSQLIGTLLIDDNGILNGKISEECQLGEKVRRFNSFISDKRLNVSVEVAYGNLPVDIPMLKLASKSFYVLNGQLDKYAE